MKNKKCPLWVYCECDCNTCTKEDKKEKLQIMLDVVVPVVEELCSVILPVMHDVVKTIYQGWKEVIKTYPYKKVAYLALYHPKKRVRKKNEKRILKWIMAHLKNSSKEFSIETEWEKIEPEGYFPAWECTKCGNIIVEEDECISLPDCEKCKDGKRVSKVFFDESRHEAGGNGKDAE